jgi:hypothetical protein
MNSVASGPNNKEIKNQFRPLLFFPWASPAFISASVPHPTKYWLPDIQFLHHLFFLLAYNDVIVPNGSINAPFHVTYSMFPP